MASDAAAVSSVVLAAHRVGSGIHGLDELIGGGFPANRSVLLCGEPGTGKTTFALQFLAHGLARGEHGAFMSVDEKPRHLVEDAAGFGWDLAPAVSRGELALLDASAYFTVTRGRNGDRSSIDARLIAGDLTQQIRSIKAQRLVIDSFTSLIPPSAGRWMAYDYLRSLIHSLEDNLGCTILLTCRPPSDPDPQGGCEAAQTLTSGVVELRLSRNGNGYERTLFVRKMRGTRTDLAEHPFSIEPGRGLALAGQRRV